MAETEQISTPGENTDVNTSSNELTNDNQDVNTSNDELTPDNKTAEITDEQTKANTKDEKKLFADKYSSIEEFEKGYKELNKELTQLKQMQGKYNEYLKRQETQNAIRLEQAREQGFNSVHEKEIAERAAVEEFNAYANAINTLSPEFIEPVRQNLLEYYKTGNTTYLEEAKRYFPSDFIERIALGKQNLINHLKGEYEQQAQKIFNEQEFKLAETIKSDFADFLNDIKDNTGKSQALQMFCNAGFIQSKEDFQVFSDIYNAMAAFEKAKAIKEYETAKTIEKTKNKAVINGDVIYDKTNKPTIEDVARMSQKAFDEYCDKYGTDWIYSNIK